MTRGSTNEGDPKVKNSGVSAGGFLQLAPTRKGQLPSQKKETFPSALPRNLLPLLGRGLTISSSHGSHSLEHQSGGLHRKVKPSVSAAASGRVIDPTEPVPTQLPHTQTHTPEQEGESTTMDMLLGVDTDTGTPPGMSSHCET